MQTATHRNTVASRQDRTPTAVRTRRYALWTSSYMTILGRNLHNLLSSHPRCCSFPERGTPVTSSNHRPTDTHEAGIPPVITQVIAKSVHLLCHRLIPEKESFFWVLAALLRGIAVGMRFLLFGLRENRALVVHPRASKSSRFPLSTSMKINAGSL